MLISRCLHIGVLMMGVCPPVGMTYLTLGGATSALVGVAGVDHALRRKTELQKFHEVCSLPVKCTTQSADKPKAYYVKYHVVAMKYLADWKVRFSDYSGLTNQSKGVVLYKSQEQEGVPTFTIRRFREIKEKEIDQFTSQSYHHVEHSTKFSLSEDEWKKIPKLQANQMKTYSRHEIEQYLQKVEKITDHFVLPSEDSSLIPLVLPSSIGEMIRTEERRLAVKGVHLMPAYSFKKSEERYTLSVIWHAISGKKNLGQRAELELATFDKKTVQSFGAPMIHNNKVIHEQPDLNHFLLHALQEENGLPGNQSVSLDTKGLFAPVDQPFRGLFNLLKEEGKCVHYDHARVNGSVSLGEELSLKKTPIRDVDCSKTVAGYQRYCDLYQVAKGVAVAAQEVPPIISDLELMLSGLVLPARGNSDELFYALAKLPNARQFAAMDTEKTAATLENTARPSDLLKRLREAV